METTEGLSLDDNGSDCFVVRDIFALAPAYRSDRFIQMGTRRRNAAMRGVDICADTPLNDFRSVAQHESQSFRRVSPSKFALGPEQCPIHSASNDHISRVDKLFVPPPNEYFCFRLDHH